tara:strand:+ start:7373 stop:7711 length:339 start_codon:yes stop_codon:yes gene_type:complete
MPSRYDRVQKFVNKDKIYKNIFKNRGVSQIQQFGTRSLRYPSTSQISQLDIIAHQWSYGDHYYKLAFENYGDSTLWWVIAFFNQKPTETSFRFGSIVYIPHPIEKVLDYYGV